MTIVNRQKIYLFLILTEKPNKRRYFNRKMLLLGMGAKNIFVPWQAVGMTAALCADEDWGARRLAYADLR